MLCIGIISSLLITGCWDKVEIEKRAFVALIGIDKFDSKDGKKNKDSDKTKESQDISRNKYVITIAYPNTGVIAGKGEGESKYIYASVGQNIRDILGSLNNRIARVMFFRHTKAIVLGKALASDEKMLREVLDAIERSPEIGRKINLMITPGEAKEILNTSTKDEPVLGLFIRELMEQSKRSARMADADFGYILRSLHESKVAITPRILSSKDQFKIAGSAVLKNFKMVGELGELETRNVMFMFDKIQSTVINVKVDDLIIPIGMTDSKTKMKVFEKDGELYTSFDIEAEGDLEQHMFEVKGQPLDNKYIQKVEKIASKTFEKQIEATYKKIQKDFGADLVQAGEYLRKHEPDTWKKVEKDWDEIFPTTKVKVNVAIKIRRIGVTQ